MPPRKKAADKANSKAAPTAKTKKVTKKGKSTKLANVKKFVTTALKGKGDPFVEIDEDRLKTSLPHLPTGSIVMDFLIGGRPNRFGVLPCPGLPRHRLVNLYGQESSGKTTLALTAAATTIARGGLVCFIDWEHAIDLAYAKTLGIPINDESKFMLAQPETLEQGLKVVWATALAGIDLIIIDSVSAGTPESILKQDFKEKGSTGRLGEDARIWSGYLRQIKSVLNRTASCIIGISQLRSTIGGSGGGQTTSGGNSWKFYSELRINLRRVKVETGKDYDVLIHKMDDTPVCNVIKATIDKCKVAASQGRKGEFYIRLGEGIDDLRSVIEIGAAHGVINKGGAWYSWERPNGEALKGQGMEAFKAKILGAPGAREELYKATLTKMTSADSAEIPTAVVEADLSDLEALLTGDSDAEEESDSDAEEESDSDGEAENDEE